MIRLFSTLILAAAALVAVWYLPLFWFQCLVLFAIALGLWEYAAMMFSRPSDRLLTFIFGTALAAFVTWGPRDARLILSVVLIFFLIFLWGMKKKDPLDRATSHVGLILVGVSYLGLTLPFWSWIRELGREWVMLLLFPACLTDTFSFLIGKTIGRHKLAPVISPDKTWEGFWGGLLGGVFGLWLAACLFFPEWKGSWVWLIGIGMSISLLASLGDLMESLLKRSAGVKDSSHLIPGHGGALDRLDALVFTAPWFYFLVNVLKVTP